MKSVYFDSEFDDRVLSFLSARYAKVFSRVWRCDRNRVGVFTHEEYVLRTSSNQTITCIFESGRDGQRSKVTVIASGGGQGLFGFDWGSQGAGESTVVNRIKEVTGQH
ncbi:MAG: DUF6054 family protein [Candidatus Thorarchaeota archaeon]